MIIILNRPQMGENVGFAARSMKNFGGGELILVNPGLMAEGEWQAEENNINFKLDAFLEKAEAVAKGGAEIIKNAKIFSSLEEASSGIHRIYALSARRRELAKEVLTPETAIKEILNFEGKSAFMFGREANGLSNYDLSFAYKIIEIEANSEYPSINLGMSVGLISYLLQKLSKGEEFEANQRGIRDLGSSEDISHMINLLKIKLENARYFKVPEKKEGMMINIKNIFSRHNMTKAEIKTLIGIFNLIK